MSLFSKITTFARSPSGQRALRTAAQKAQAVAKDPRTKAKVEELRRRGTKRGGQDGSAPTS